MTTNGAAVPEHPAVQQTAPQPQAVWQQQQTALLPGVTIATDRDMQSPMLSVCSPPKFGKSRTVITSLIDWPAPGMHPLVIAVDDSGPLSCIDAGYYPHRVRLREEDYPGVAFDMRIRMALSGLTARRQELRQRYGSIVVDCGSTLADKLHDAAKRLTKNANNPQMQAPFFELGIWFKEVMNRIRELDLPSIWLSWQTEGFVQSEKDAQGRAKVTSHMGGPDIMGAKLRNYYSGQFAHNFILERRKVGTGMKDYETGQLGDGDGNVRVLHSKPYNNVDAGGRLQRFLPAVCPAHIGWILSAITGKGPYAQQTQQQPQPGAPQR